MESFESTLSEIRDRLLAAPDSITRFTTASKLAVEALNRYGKTDVGRIFDGMDALGVDDTAVSVAAFLARAGVEHLKRPDVDELCRKWREALTRVEESQDRPLFIHLSSLFGGQLSNFGFHAEAVEHCERGLRMTGSGLYPEARVTFFTNLACACAMLGYWKRSLWLSERAEREHVSLNFLQTGSRAYNLLNYAECILLISEDAARDGLPSNLDALREGSATVGRVLAMCGAINYINLEVAAHVLAAKLHLMLAEWDAAEEQLQAARTAFPAIRGSDDELAGSINVAQAKLFLMTGKPAEALQAIQGVRRPGPTASATHFNLRYWECMAQVCKANGDWVGALASLEAYSQLSKRIDRRRVELLFATLTARVESEHSRALSFLSHDLRSPLTSIIAACRAPSHDPQEALLAVASVADRALAWTDQSLDYMRAAQLGEGEMYPVDLSDVLEDCCSQLAPVADSKQVKIVVEASGPAMVLGSRPLLVRAVSNVIVNAVQFSPSGASVKSALDADGPVAWRLRIEDSGIGLSDVAEQNLFEPGYSSRDSHGLGLAFVALTLSKHHGFVGASNRAGGGTCVEMTLPALLPDDQTIVPIS